MKPFLSLSFGQRYQTLPPACYQRVSPTPLSEPYPVVINEALCAQLGLEPASLLQPAAVAVLAGCRLTEGMQPLAALYSGHQFGVYVPQLGDGRALLLGDTQAEDGTVWEWQLKGAGPTPFSRSGDGRAVLRSSIREYLCSEAMHGLGIPTTRALAIMGSDEAIYRETVETAAVVTRLAESFIRFGSFEVFYHRGQHDLLRELADYVIRQHYPLCAESAQPYQALFTEICRRTALLMADWQAVGFCHGVMNTDNMSILGLTLDYGPFGFLDGFDAGHICNHSDHRGRYAYQQQAQIALWNLHCLASAFLPLVAEDVLLAALQEYRHHFEQAYLQRMRAKLGLQQAEAEDGELISALLLLLHAQHTDFTLFFRRLADFPLVAGGVEAVRDLVIDRDLFDQWALHYRQRLQLENSVDGERRIRMQQVNPKYILRNHLAETAIRQAVEHSDYSEINRLQRCLQQPFAEQPEFEAYAGLPPDWASSLSVSCSS
ncbi:YdiU family protein [Neisseriaceae bacterium TC5R-5]|nr:YdiU family protein [Neisseriaceae bacterium TC5R-5]